MPTVTVQSGPVKVEHGLGGFSKPPLSMPKPRSRPDRALRYKPKDWKGYFDSMDFTPDVPKFLNNNFLGNFLF